MRPRGLVGMVLIAAGAVLVMTGGEFSTRRSVLEIGDLEVTASERRSVPVWAGGLVVLAGVGVLVTGRRSR